MNLLLRLLLVYGSFMIGAVGPAVFDSNVVVTVWMAVWCAVTLGMAVWTKSWHA